MEIKIDTKSFKKAVKECNSIIKNNTTMEMLECISLNVKKVGFLEVSATNLETETQSIINYTCEEGEIKESDYGRIIVKGNKMKQQLTAIKEKEIILEKTEDHLKITNEKGEFQINLPLIKKEDEFPRLDLEKKYETSFFVLKEDIKKAESKMFCASKDESKPFLNGGFMSVKEGKMALVATDTYRLSVVEMEVDCQKEVDGIIIPNDFLKVFKTFNEEEVEIKMNNNEIMVIDGNKKVHSKLIEGQFPNYKQILPGKNEEKTVIINPANFLEKVAVVSASIKDPAITLSFENDVLKLTIKDESSSAYAELDYKGNIETKTTLDVKYLKEYLTSVKEKKEIEFKVEDPLSPIRCDTEGFIHILMPLRGA